MNLGTLPISAAFVAAFLLPSSALAHDWYSKRTDPRYAFPCCGGHDCAAFPFAIGKNIFPTEEGYRIVLSVEEARRINPAATAPIDAIVEWNRVQVSEDGRWHICIADSFRLAPHFGILCFFEPNAV